MAGHYSPLRLRRGVRGEVAAHCNPTPNPSPRAGRGDERRNHVLMLVVWKLNGELPLIFRLRSLIRAIRFAESEPAIFARRGAQMTDSADCRAGAAQSLTREELRPMTTHACVVIGKIRDIGERAVRSPCRRNLVTGVALETFVFVGRVQKSGILCGRTPGRLRLRGRSSRGGATARLRRDDGGER